MKIIVRLMLIALRTDPGDYDYYVQLCHTYRRDITDTIYAPVVWEWVVPTGNM